MGVLFPHEQVRKVQKQMMDDVSEALEKQKHLVVHAPTGLGKTAATLSPALSLALQRDLTVFFLTSRHTQHKIVLDTLRAIKKKAQCGIHRGFNHRQEMDVHPARSCNNALK